MTQIVSIIALLALCAGLAFGFVPVNVWSLLALLCLIIAAIKG